MKRETLTELMDDALKASYDYGYASAVPGACTNEREWRHEARTALLTRLTAAEEALAFYANSRMDGAWNGWTHSEGVKYWISRDGGARARAVLGGEAEGC